MLTSATIAEELGESAVMVRRMFLLLHKGGWIVQRKGPNGGAQLNIPAKQIGLGDLFAQCPGVAGGRRQVSRTAAEESPHSGSSGDERDDGSPSGEADASLVLLDELDLSS